MTKDLYVQIIESFPVGENTDYPEGKTCNLFATDVCDALCTPLLRQDNGKPYDCANILPELRNNYLSWRKSGTDGKSFAGAQLAANTGRTAVAITYDHIAIVRPNSTGRPPESITDVCLAQAGPVRASTPPLIGAGLQIAITKLSFIFGRVILCLTKMPKSI